MDQGLDPNFSSLRVVVHRPLDYTPGQKSGFVRRSVLMGKL